MRGQKYYVQKRSLNMAIVRSEDGRFFDVDDTELDKHEIKPEDLPTGSVYARPQGGPGMGGPGAGGPGMGGPRGGGGGPVQLVINLGGGGGMGGGAPQMGSGPQASGPVQRGQGGQQAGARGDVQAHNWCGMPWPWGNWHNWHNWNNWNNWMNCWNNCWHNCS
jgi:hypothetical protein